MRDGRFPLPSNSRPYPGNSVDQAGLVEFFRGPNRVILEVEPTYKLGFDSDNMWANVERAEG